MRNVSAYFRGEFSLTFLQGFAQAFPINARRAGLSKQADNVTFYNSVSSTLLIFVPL